MTTNEHHHHRHHHSHHHRSREEYLKREQQERREAMLKRARRIAAIAFVSLAVLIIALALFAPQYLGVLGNCIQLQDNGVTVGENGNTHLRLDYDGIDVSHHQGNIDWERVAGDSGVTFVYIKATEGSDMKDSHYNQNVDGARKAGIAIGSYHYLTSQSSIDNQFRNFYSMVDRRIQTLAPMIDVEQEGVRGWTGEQVCDSVEKLAHLIQTHYHCVPVIYAYARFYNENLAPRFNSYPLFLARYNVKQPVVAGAGNHKIWQHTDQGIIDGISVPVDLDVLSTGTTLEDISMP